MKYLRVYRDASGSWAAQVLAEVDALSGHATPLEALLAAKERHPDAVDLPAVTQPPEA